LLDLTEVRAVLIERYDLAPTVDWDDDLQGIYAHMDRVVSPADWTICAPYVKAINDLKARKNAVILGHNYMTPEIFHGVADFVGDSLQLAMKAAEVEADIIVQAGVHFMAETSKILSPEKTVLMPDMDAGCSLAESITADGIEEMRAKYPGAPVVTYVNTTAEVKAASDICCTSSNALQIVNAMESDTVIMTPDQYLAQNIANQSHKNVVYWPGSCIVHEQYTAKDLRDFREWNPGTRLIAHPECPPDVVAEADFSGSTSGIIKYVTDEKPEKGHADHRMFDGIEHRRSTARGRFCRPVQHVPLHEEDHPGEDPLGTAHWRERNSCGSGSGGKGPVVGAAHD